MRSTGDGERRAVFFFFCILSRLPHTHAYNILEKERSARSPILCTRFPGIPGDEKNKKTTENQGSASAEGGNQGKNVTWTTEQGDDSACESDANQQVLKVAKSDSGITRHLKTSSKCRDVVCRSNFTSRFKVIARARNASHLGFLEALFIERYTPELCAQKEFVRTLGLF